VAATEWVVPDQVIVVAVFQHTDLGTADAQPVLLRFQRPLPKPDMKFSFIRLSPRQSTTSIPHRHTSWPVAQAPVPDLRLLSGVDSLPAIPTAVPRSVRTPGYRSFARAGLCCPCRHHYYYLLRLPLSAPPLRRATAYRFRCYRAPSGGTPTAITFTGAETDLSSSRGQPSDRSTLPYAGGFFSTRSRIPDAFHGLHPAETGSAPSCPHPTGRDN
jgi:hypothetical protein